MELHGTLGPSRTSISAIAERAGVRRSTVYRHFPDEASLFAACSSHCGGEPGAGHRRRGSRSRIRTERLRTALDELYAYYRRTEPMMDNLLRDEMTMPIIAGQFAPYHQYMAAVRDLLMRGRSVRGRRRDQAAPPSVTRWRTRRGGRSRASRS